MLGNTFAQTGDLSDQIGDLAELLVDVFAADAAMITLVLPDGQYKDTLAGDDWLCAQLRAARHQITNVATAPRVDAPATMTVPSAFPAGDGGDVQLTVAPLQSEGETIGALVLAIAQPDHRDTDESAMLAMVAGQIAATMRSARMVRRLETTNLETVEALAAAIEAKDQYTATHADNIANMAVAVGCYMGLSGGSLRQLAYAAVLHDVGKIGVPGHILNKPEPLAPEEHEKIAQHTVIGERIVSRVDHLRPVARIIRSAHERWDGTGYPDGLAGEDIPLLSRILFVCDAYDAMINDRRYRGAMASHEAIAEMRSSAGTQFDPEVVDVFLDVLEVEAGERASMAGWSVELLA